MRTRLAVVVTVVVAAFAGATAGPAAAAPIEIAQLPQCLELAPAAISLDNAPTRLDVRVLLDGVSGARGSAVVQTAQASYGPLGITLAPTFQSVSFGGTTAQGLIDQAKALFGGVRPPGTDVVFTLTNKDVDGAVAGLADCIGGVAFPARAFAMGENFTPDEGTLLGLGVGPANRNLTGKVMAHEVGHLLGGHHHYANCVQGLPDILKELSPCTLMFNDVGLASLNFSTLNSVIVRGHAPLYARP